MRVELVAVTPTGETATVHNLNVDSLHNYHVQASEGQWIRVHNACTPEVTFSRVKAPAIAANFDDAVAQGPPTRLTRVDAAMKRMNRREAQRGVPRVPGLSLDEYPFPSSAQGGAGAHVCAVPVSEQHYQGATLKNFFEREGVGIGDTYDVGWKD
ncbi:NucA/NucB deoxyribonuclease domain-containing protein [uncultured Jatrophihabitans sp.]|uniref:NucA/NucB deoxyribonuclease domain-containing protein n=1 Tax=uncultured Jatrophihabitans sp. TaxID=1610747 RepID=UPI0035CA1EEE